MKQAKTFGKLSPLEKVLTMLDVGPLGAAYRAAVGFALVPALAGMTAAPLSTATLGISLVIVLVMLRLVPLVFRILLPFPAPVQTIWFDRRQLGKQFDSYQWRKLFWIGIGLGGYALTDGQWSDPQTFLTLFCVLSGLCGLLRWQMVNPSKTAKDRRLEVARA